jgi:putative glutamine amidotransferase
VDRPFVGVTTYLTRARWGRWDTEAALLPSRYVELVRAAGGLVALLPPDDPASAAAMLSRIDALVVSGGPDVDPARYGEARHPRTDPPEPERDAWELALTDAALRGGVPLLGICRGMQVLNVVRGGTLVQHLPDVVSHEEHGGSGHPQAPAAFGEHLVRVAEGSRLSAILPGESVVPTLHHQAVGVLGRDLLASAHAEDGTVEGLELPGAAFALGVQWHPEMDDDLRLVRALLDAVG